MTRGNVQFVLAAALLFGLAGACSHRENRAPNNSSGESTDTTARSDARDTGSTGAGATQQGGRQGTTAPIGVAQIASNPSQYVGQRVTVRADVGAPVGASAFTLTETPGPGTAAAARQVLVLTPSGAPSDRHGLTVSGTVRVFTSASDLHRDVPWLSSGSAAADLGRLRDRPVIVADSIRTTDGRELVSGTGAGALPAGPGDPGDSSSGTPSPGSGSSAGPKGTPPAGSPGGGGGTGGKGMTLVARQGVPSGGGA